MHAYASATGRPTPSLSSPEAPRRGPRAEEGDEEDGGGRAGVRRWVADAAGEEMKAKALPFIAFEHKRFVPASPSRAHLGDALVGLRCFGGFFFSLGEFLLETCARVFRRYFGISRGSLSGARY